MEFWELIHRGFRIWRSRPGLCLPFLVGWILELIVIIAIAAWIALALISLPLEPIRPLEPRSILESIAADPWRSLSVLIWGALLGSIIVLMIREFALGWGINICRQTYAGELQGFPLPGAATWIKLVIANLILSGLLLLGIVFVLPGIMLLIPGLDRVWEAFLSWVQTRQLNPELIPNQAIQGLILIGIGGLIWAGYSVAILIMFSLRDYGIVIHGLGPISGLSWSLRIFLNNKLELAMLNLLVWGLQLGVSWIFSLASGYHPAAALMAGMGSGLIGIFILIPLQLSWFCSFYLDRAPSPKISSAEQSL